MKHFLICILAIILVAFPLASCTPKSSQLAATAEGSGTSSASETGEKPYLDGVKFDYPTITIHVRGDESAVDEIGLEDYGDVLSTALYARTMATMDRLDVEIAISRQNPYGTYNATINSLRNSILSAYGDYDLVAGWSPRIVPLIAENLFYDLNGLPYYNGNDAWWSRSVTDALTVGGHTYLNTGDIAATYMDSCYAVVVNQKVSSDNQYAYDSFYDIVDSGDWTLDYFYQIVKDTYADNGNGIRDEDDTYGLVMSYDAGDCFWTSSGISIVENNGVDYPTMSYNTDYIQRVVDGVYNLMYDNIGAEVIPEKGNAAISNSIAQFTNDRSMFIILTLGRLATLSADMSTTYGVLPVPKFDAAQEHYYTNVQQSMSLWGVPVDVKNKEASVAVLTSLGYDSNRLVIEPHYERLLKVRYVKDSTSGYMIDLIYNGIWMNFDTLYNETLGTSVTASARVTMPAYVFRTMSKGEKTNITRWWAENQTGLNDRLTALLNNFFGVE